MPSPGRRRPLSLLALLVLALSQSSAVMLWAEQARAPLEMLDDAALTNVFFLDSDQGWAVGERGVILHTDNGGRQWQLQRSPVTCRLESIHFMDNQCGWVVGGWVHPYTHHSSCVVLRTQDGGRNWIPVPGLTLPALKHVRFFDDKQGWAVGNSSALYPTGIFRTEDGGRSWATLPAGISGRWNAADFRDTRHGVVAGHEGQLATISAPRIDASSTPSLGLRPLRSLKMCDAQCGWLVGDGGLVLQTSDAGLTWQLPEGVLPPGVASLFDFRALSTVGDHVWVAGAPGTRVLHSADRGRSWELLRTDQNLPIHAMTFVDAERGWAVGALGTILGTRDGGRSWRRLRSGGTRLALLGLFGEPGRIPLELFARESGNEGYLGFAEILNRRDVEFPEAEDAPLEDQTCAAMAAVGACGADHSWRFPLRQAGLKLGAREIVSTWDRVNDGRSIALLEELIVRKIRQWRPEVVITEPASPRGNQPLSHVINQIVLSAVRNAADATAFPDQAIVAGLEPWAVKKVFSVVDDNQEATVTLSTAQLATRLGRSVADLASDGYAAVTTQYDRTAVTVGFRLLLDELPQSVGRKDIFSGIFLQPGGEARRLLGQPAQRDLEALTRAAQQQRNIEQIFDITAGDSANASGWLGQVNDLTRTLSATNAGQVLFQLAQRYRDAGRVELAAQSFEQLVERYPDHALSETALVWLIQYYASGEVGWQLRRQTHVTVQQASARVQGAEMAAGVRSADYRDTRETPAAVGAVQAGLETQGRSATLGIGLGSTERAAQAIAFARLVQRGRPELFAEPWVQFPVSVAYRNKGMPRDAERFYHRLSATPTPSDWSRCAQTELWLSHGRGLAPKTTYACKMGASRPRLDGQLTDDIWRTATRLELSSAQHDDDAWPAAAMLAGDAEFLYLAISCRQAPTATYPDTPGPRPRDPDLSDRDRVDVLIDTDRDYASYYRLTVDHRGWCGEACFGNVQWNPTWYVANAISGDEWTIEAAIAWTELAPQGPQTNDVWAFGVQRIVPGVGVQAFTQPASVDPRPEGFALLVFQQ